MLNHVICKVIGHKWIRANRARRICKRCRITKWSPI